VVDPVVALEKAALTHLKADAAVTAVIPAAQLYTYDGAPPSPPKPFAKPGTSIAAPLTGHRRRRDIRFTIFVRADARQDGAGTVLETARDHMGRCVSVIVDSLYRARLPIPGGNAKLVLINDIRRMVDGEQDALEANIEFRARLMAG
jgi:hypothetical protein